MARPNFSTIFDSDSGYVVAGTPAPVNGIFLSEDALTDGAGFLDGADIDAQRFYWLLTTKMSQTLNEANRNNDISGIVSTITYGSYDSIIDPPGSTSVFRRDIFSSIAYTPQTFSQFDPEAV